MSLIGSLAAGALSIVNPAAGLAIGAARAAAGFARRNGKAVAIVSAVAALVTTFLILRGEVRHRDKIIAAQTALMGDISREVDRGVGKPTQAADAPTYVRGFVDNLATVKAALDRQSAALKAAQAEAQAHIEAALRAAQPTPAQQERESLRRTIIDPSRTTGLSANEWSSL